MEKEVKVKFSIKDFFKTLGEVIWNPDYEIYEDEELPKELQEVSEKLTKEAKALTDVKIQKSKSKAKTEKVDFSKNISRESRDEKQRSNNSKMKSKNINNEGREREE